MMNNDVMIKVENLKKIYRLGQYGYGTLSADFQSWIAKIKGKKDPNSLLSLDDMNAPKDILTVLNGIDFEVKKGEVLGILGRNGAGKSTLLKLLTRITAPSEGTICLNGKVASMLEVGTGFTAEMTGRENIYMNGTILGMKKAEIDSKIDEIIKFSECEKFIDTPVKRYSSGMYVKLAFAVAAHLDSDILIMDEVLAVGDIKFQKKCIKKMLELVHSQNRTVLYVSHNMNTVKALCSRCMVLNQGKIIFDGDVDEGIKLYNDQEMRSEVAYTFEDYSTKLKTDFASLNTVVFKNKTKPKFEYDEKIILQLNWTPKIQDAEFFIRLVLNNPDKNPIGMSTVSLGKNFTDFTPRTVELEFYSDIISDGEYFLTFELYKINEEGTPSACYWSELYANIEIMDNPNDDFKWDKHNWGDILFKDIKISE